MDQSYVLPFIKSVQNVFETMLQLPVTIGEPHLKTDASPSYDVSGIIGMSGDVEGSIVVSYPVDVAERVVALFTGMELAHTHEDFADAVGELVNMVSGSAKAQFHGKNVSISCPSVVVGKNHQVFGRKDVVCICIPCQCEVGSFNVEVSVKTAAVPASA